MKNYIPLVMAVLLGLAAVLAVSRAIRVQRQAKETTVSVVRAARDLAPGEQITADAIRLEDVPGRLLPSDAVLAKEAALLLDGEVGRHVRANDYVTASDLADTRQSRIAPRELGVPVPLPDTCVTRMLRPGDEVALIAHLSVPETVESTEVGRDAMVRMRNVTAVLFPRLRVMETFSRGDAVSEILLSLRPDEALFVMDVQRKAELDVLLRRRGDESFLSREDVGVVNERTYEALTKDLRTIQVPVAAIPAGVRSAGSPGTLGPVADRASLGGG